MVSRCSSRIAMTSGAPMRRCSPDSSIASGQPCAPQLLAQPHAEVAPAIMVIRHDASAFRNPFYGTTNRDPASPHPATVRKRW
jgi:hypothetical protein